MFGLFDETVFLMFDILHTTVCCRDDNFTVTAEDVGRVRGVEIRHDYRNLYWCLNKVSF